MIDDGDALTGRDETRLATQATTRATMPDERIRVSSESDPRKGTEPPGPLRRVGRNPSNQSRIYWSGPTPTRESNSRSHPKEAELIAPTHGVQCAPGVGQFV